MRSSTVTTRKVLVLGAVFLSALFLFPTLISAGPPSGAVKFVIVKPDHKVTVGTFVTLTIEAQTSNNKVDASYQSDVTLLASGSAAGGGLVDIVNGVGTVQVTDLVAETVIFSLSDTESTGLDVSSSRDIVFEELPIGAVWEQTDFWFRDDDGTEASATGYGSVDIGKNINISGISSGSFFRLRFGIKVTVADGIVAPRFEFKEGSDCDTGSWTVIDSASGIFRLRSSSNFNDGDVTTKQIVGGSFTSGQILESTNPAPSFSLQKNGNTEYEWSVEAVEGLSPDAFYSFRVTNDAIPFSNYGVCPVLSTGSQLPYQSSEGGSSGMRPTFLSFSGRSFPGAKILIMTKDEAFENIVGQEFVADLNGNFYISFPNTWRRLNSFGFLVKDKDNRTAQTKFFNINVIGYNFAVNNILVSPTVGLTQRMIGRGQHLVILGYASPDNKVVVEIDGIMKEETVAGEDGSYKVTVDTGTLEFGKHHLRVKQVDVSQGQESDYSSTNDFTVSRLTLPKTDLSGDGLVDVRDLSMFFSGWKSTDESQRKTIDFNGDGIISISDFSIFIRTIKK